MNILKPAVCLLISIVIIGPSYNIVLAGGKKALDPAALYEEKCSICHVIERSRSKRKSGPDWEKTVMRMKNINGAPITYEEAEIIIRHLTDIYGK